MSSMKSQLSCPTRPAWFEVDLARLSSNFRLIRKDASNDLIIGSVVKDNGYGHGSVEVANVALANGAQLLLVSNLDEAFELREAGIVEQIILMGCLLYTSDAADE